MAVNTETRTAVWHAIHDSARWGRYYGTLADRYRRREVFIRSVLLTSVMGSITTLVAATDPVVQALVGGAVGIAMVFDIVLRPSQTAAVLTLIRDECGQARVALDELWMDLSTITEEEARRRFNHLNRHLAHVTAMDPVPEDKAVNRSTSMAALKELDAKRDTLAAHTAPSAAALS